MPYGQIPVPGGFFETLQANKERRSALMQRLMQQHIAEEQLKLAQQSANERAEMHPLKLEELREHLKQLKNPGSPAPLSPAGKAIEDAARYPEGSVQNKLLLEYAKRLSEGNPGTQFDVDTKTGAISFSQGRKGGSGSQLIDGKLVTPLTQGAQTKVQSEQLSDIVRQQVAKYVDYPYAGGGQSFVMGNDLFEYSKNANPEIGERLINAAVMDKLAPEIAMMQINSQGGKPTVSAIEHQLKAIKQGWPKAHDITVNNLPHELQNEVEKRHQIILSKLSKDRQDYIARGMPIKTKEKVSFKNKQDFLDYLQTLTPHERRQLRKEYGL